MVREKTEPEYLRKLLEIMENEVSWEKTQKSVQGRKRKRKEKEKLKGRKKRKSLVKEKEE